MRDWRMMLGALLIWALHFLLVYGVASVGDISDPSQTEAWRMSGFVLTALSLVALALLALKARSARRISALAKSLGLAGCGLSFIAVAWQSLPLFLSA